TAEAIAEFRKAVELKIDQPKTLSTLAWLLATDPDPKLRDGPQALRLAHEACRRTGYRDPNCLDALSAAYAEVGLYDDAVPAGREAAARAEAVGATALASVIRRRLPILESRRPLHP